MSDAWLLGRARELIATAQRTDHADKLAIIETLDRLLDETQRRGEPVLVAQLLRAAALARLIALGEDGDGEQLLDEMLAHTKRHGLALLRADAHALRGRLLVLRTQEDAALTEIARALAILDDASTPGSQLSRRAWDRLSSTALNDCWIVLNQLGVYEAAEEVITRAHQAIRDSAGPHEITMQLMNRVKMLIGWGLRLERVGRHDEAGDKFRTAASMAIAAEAPFAESLFPREAGVPAVDQVGVLAASLAFAAPNEAHIARLQRLHGAQGYPHENILVSIALARCFEADGRRTQAVDVLHAVRDLQHEDNSQPSMRLNLEREIARLSEHGLDSDNPLEGYVEQLENDLWSLRQSQIATLRTRREHERLSAEHGAITQQALQDPLTGLPNRRALDERLRTLAVSTPAQPLAVALVDLDGFKGVNDQHSHADGDDVLRVVASTLRDALRGDDIVARYGGDEFIVLLPSTPLSAATQALARGVKAVASLPVDLSHGVTLSVGLVSLRTQERAEEVLSRADAAMYEAKRGGGNQIAQSPPPGMDAPAESFDEAAAADPASGAWEHP